jgi:hypothetical protein
MNDDDPFASDCRVSTSSILQCLEMLADEADHLQLARTHLALRKAIRACQAENKRLAPGRSAPRPRRHLVMH